jgi:hypothetical protein
MMRQIAIDNRARRIAPMRHGPWMWLAVKKIGATLNRFDEKRGQQFRQFALGSLAAL